MGKGLWAKTWFRHIVVAVSYGLAVVLFLEMSFSQWMILAGLRLSVLLLVPYRYWPALIMGESSYFFYLSYECETTWGMTWAIVNVIPASFYIAPVMYWVRERWRPIVRGSSINMGALLGCALLVSALVMLIDFCVLHSMRLPHSYQIHNGEALSRYIIGNYLGILTVTPLGLLIWQMVNKPNWYQLRERAFNSRLLFESVSLVLPALAFLLWLGISAPYHSQMRQMVQVAMFLPVVWLALRHGWQGAAVGGAIASCAVMWLMPEVRDPATLQAEVVLAFAISTTLLMGARITVLDGRAEQERIDVNMAFAIAQRNVHAGEMQLRMASQALEQVRETVQAGFTMMMGRLRHLQPAVDDRGYRSHALVAQDQLQRLADSLYPVTLRERGLPAALREGTMAKILNECGLLYSCELFGPISLLSHTLRTTIYRIIWEAVVEACAARNISDIRVRVRGGEKYGRRGAVIRLQLCSDPIRLAHVRWDELLPRISRTTSGLGLSAIRDRAAIFEGRAKTCALPDGWSISVRLLDPILPSR